MVKQISYNEIYLLIKYIKSVLWRVVKRLSYKEDAQCLKVKLIQLHVSIPIKVIIKLLHKISLLKLKKGAYYIIHVIMRSHNL